MADQAPEEVARVGGDFRFILAEFGQSADAEHQRIRHAAGRFQSQLTLAGLGVRSQRHLQRDDLAKGGEGLPSKNLGLGPGELFLDLVDLFQGLGVLGALLLQFAESTLQRVGFPRGQAFDIPPHDGLDAAAGDAHMAAGVQVLAADRNQKGRTLPAAGRVDVADVGDPVLRPGGREGRQKDHQPPEHDTSRWAHTILLLGINRQRPQILWRRTSWSAEAKTRQTWRSAATESPTADPVAADLLVCRS